MKRTKNSNKSAVGIYVPLERPKSQNYSYSQEMLEHMHQCEAREWMRRRATKIGEVGLEAAQLWWVKVKDDIARRRGQPALDDLIKRMYKERKDGQKNV